MPRPLTLLHVQGMAERGGSDVALLRLLQSLAPAEFRCHVAVPAPHPLAAEMRAAGARLHVVPMRRISTGNGRLGWALYADGKFAEVAEIKNHPYFIAVQYHPEFKSRPWQPHPLFSGFVGAAYTQHKAHQAAAAKSSSPVA